MKDEMMFNYAVSKRANDAQEPGVEFEPLPTPRIKSRDMPITDGETSSVPARGISLGLIYEIDRGKDMEITTLSEILGCWEELKKKTEMATALGLKDLVGVLQADYIATLGKLKETELELCKMKQKNAQLRDENAQLKEENQQFKSI